MKHLLPLFLLLLFSASPGSLHAKPKRKIPAQAPIRKTPSSSARSKNSARRGAGYSARTASPARKGRGRHGKTKMTAASSWRSRQMTPSADRYREIQEALAAKGYLQTSPSGNWDADSQDALRRFQADQKLEQTGKVDSRSLIALGLGPVRAPAPEDQPK